MVKLAIWATVQAKPGKESQVEAFLKSAQPLAEAEPGTVTWYALNLGGGRFGIFDTFQKESGREAHLNGEIARRSWRTQRSCSPPIRRYIRSRFWLQRAE